MKNAQDVVTFERFVKFTGWGIVVSGVILFTTWVTLVLGIRPDMISEKKYAADFYAILQGKRNYALYNGSAENLAKVFLSWNEEQSSAFLEIVFEYLSDWRRNKENSQEALLSARAKFMQTNNEAEYKKFSDNQKVLGDAGFKNLIATPEDRERIKKILSGEKIPLYEVDITIPLLWRQMLPWFIFSQFLIGLSCFLFCWRNNQKAVKGKNYFAQGVLEENSYHNYVKRKWWRLPWKHGWPVLALIFLSPGTFPLILGAGIVTLGLKLKSSGHSKKLDILKRENFINTPFDFGEAEREGQELLSRLQERVRR